MEIKVVQEQQFAQLSEGSGNVVITRNRRLARIGLILIRRWVDASVAQGAAHVWRDLLV